MTEILKAYSGGKNLFGVNIHKLEELLITIPSISISQNKKQFFLDFRWVSINALLERIRPGEETIAKNLLDQYYKIKINKEGEPFFY